jgi:N-formylglutamate amidohydrolase
MFNRFIRSEIKNSSLVLSMPHSATNLPNNLNHNFNIDDEDAIKTLNQGVDLCVPYVSGFFEYNNASKIFSEVPRVIIDVNRLCEQVDYLSVEGRGKETDPHGLIWRTTTSLENNLKSILKKKYSKVELNELIEKVYTPYVSEIKYALKNAKEKKGIGINFDLHSMPACNIDVVKEGENKGAYVWSGKKERGKISDGNLPDLVLLHKKGLVSENIVDKVVSTFERNGLTIEEGDVRDPTKKAAYSQYADVENNIHCLGVEIVGHTFEPRRLDGLLEYNNKDEKKYKSAFLEVYEVLSNYS